MPELYEVTAVSGLRLREKPVDGRTVSVLEYGDVVEKLGPSDNKDWWRVAANVGPVVEEGFVARNYLFATDPKPRNAFRLPFFSNVKASYDRVSRFVGSFADDYPPETLTVLNEIMSRYGINKTPRRFCHFMAQLAHESTHFTALEENLNYSAEGLLRTFPRYFSGMAEAESYARQPERIANRVYANRYDNGPEESGDGWRYRGRGFIQLTFRSNYRDIGARIGEDLENHPELVSDNVAIAVHASAAYWDMKKINKAADRDDVERVTKLVNGGYRGLRERRKLLRQAQSIWG